MSEMQTKQQREVKFQAARSEKKLAQIAAGKPQRGDKRRARRAEWMKNNALLDEKKRISWALWNKQ